MTPEEAFDRYHRAVFDFVYRITRRPDVAEDITQDCFLAFVRAPERFDSSRASLKTYLFAIARNLTLGRFRNSWRESPLDADGRFPEAIASSDTSMMVADAVAKLPPLQQEALILFEYEGLTVEEIAMVVDADGGSVKSRLHRARVNLKAMLAPTAAGGVSK